MAEQGMLVVREYDKRVEVCSPLIGGGGCWRATDSGGGGCWWVS